MSAIGSYVRLKESDLARCLQLATSATPHRPFRWPWQARAESSLEAFEGEWTSAVLEEVVFDESGYLLASYFLAQAALNHVTDPFDSVEGKILAKVFTGGVPVRDPRAFPELPTGALEAFCRSEWGDEGEGMAEGIAAAHAFFNAGISLATRDEPTVFIIA